MDDVYAREAQVHVVNLAAGSVSLSTGWFCVLDSKLDYSIGGIKCTSLSFE